MNSGYDPQSANSQMVPSQSDEQDDSYQQSGGQDDQAMSKMHPGNDVYGNENQGDVDEDLWSCHSESCSDTDDDEEEDEGGQDGWGGDEQDGTDPENEQEDDGTDPAIEPGEDGTDSANAQGGDVDQEDEDDLNDEGVYDYQHDQDYDPGEAHYGGAHEGAHEGGHDGGQYGGYEGEQYGGQLGGQDDDGGQY